MKLKGISAFEQHADKIALGVFGAFLLVVLLFQVGLIGGSRSVKVGNQEVSLDRAGSLVRDRAGARLAKLNAAEVAEGIPASLPGAKARFAEVMSGGVGATSALAAALDVARRADPDVTVAHGAAAVANAVMDDDRVLSLDEGLVVDERAISAVVAGEGTAIAVWPEGAERPIAAERIAADSFFAGIGCFPGRLVRTVAGRLGDWDMQATLLRAIDTAAG